MIEEHIIKQFIIFLVVFFTYSRGGVGYVVLASLSILIVKFDTFQGT